MCEGLQDGIEVHPPLVYRPGVSGELGSTPQKSDHHSTTVVRVPGFSFESGFNRESPGEDVKIDTEPGIEASEAEGSPQACEMK